MGFNVNNTYNDVCETLNRCLVLIFSLTTAIPVSKTERYSPLEKCLVFNYKWKEDFLEVFYL